MGSCSLELEGNPAAALSNLDQYQTLLSKHLMKLYFIIFIPVRMTTTAMNILVFTTDLRARERHEPVCRTIVASQWLFCQSRMSWYVLRGGGWLMQDKSQQHGTQNQRYTCSLHGGGANEGSLCVAAASGSGIAHHHSNVFNPKYRHTCAVVKLMEDNQLYSCNSAHSSIPVIHSLWVMYPMTTCNVTLLLRQNCSM